VHDDNVAIAPGTRAAHSLPAATMVGRVALQVSDLERSIRFYETMLGFRTLERMDLRAVLGDAQGAPLLELCTHAHVEPAIPQSLGLYHFAILLSDRAALGRLIRHLTVRNLRIGSSDHLVSEAIYLSDPDGLGIEVYADRPRSLWRAHGRELAMAVDPLDFDSLLHAAGAEEWEGMPAGTIIGHVHLRVGDIARAREFYHERIGLDITASYLPGALFLSAGGYHHHLGVNTWLGPHAAPPPPDTARLLHWELVIPDADAARAAIERVTASFAHVVEVAPGTWELQDPWKTAVRIHTGTSA
jgi:catechol 2,3-dioxygenase